MSKTEKNTSQNENLIIDEAQQAAITHGEGPLMIVAGAGTGKTRVITERIAWLISNKKCLPEEILALTFSEKASKEMEERLDRLVPYGMVETHISTFHSFGKMIIDDNFMELNIAPDWDMMKETDAAIFVVENMDEFDLDLYKPLNNPAMYLLELIKMISKLKDNLILPNEYTEYALNLAESADDDADREMAAKHKELAAFYAKYEELKTIHNRIDYGDLILVPYKLFKEKKSVLKRYTDTFKYILIDEFQDTNHAQFELIKLISDANRNINVVGDDDQMIYKFRGAAISNIMNFREHYSDAQVVVLKNNYRSEQSILDASYKLIKNNSDRLETKLGIDKKLVSKYKADHKIQHLNAKLFENYSDEADFVVEEIQKLVKKEYYSYSDFAILVRAKNDAKIIIKTLEKAGIPFRFTGDEGLYNKKEIQLLINFCRTLADPYNFNPVFDVAISDFYSIEPMTVSKIGSVAKDHALTLYDLMKNIEKYSEIEIDKKEIKKIKILIADIEHYLGMVKQNMSAGEILYDFIKSRLVFENLLEANTNESDRVIANISKFFEILKHFAVNEEYDTVFNFVNYIDLSIKAGENPKEDILESMDDNTVQIATIHKSKGLEFKVVFIIALIQDKFPGKKRGGISLPMPEEIMHDIVEEEVYRQEEERRLFYVAATRAKDALYLTAARQYDGAGNKKTSIFMKEIGFDTPEEFAVSVDKKKRLEFFEKRDTILENYKVETKDKVLKLSNYQIDDYLTCPFKYKLVHRLKLPTKDDFRVMYGQAVHLVTSEFYKARMEGRKTGLDELKKIFDNMWKPVGFQTIKHAEKRYQAGVAAIENFYRNESAHSNVPKYIEKPFEFKLSENLMVRGRWDRIDEIDGKIVIVDYKTSDVRDDEKAKSKLKSPDIDRQLKLYSLAYEKMYGKLADEVGIYFFESGIFETKKFRDKTVRDYEEKIFEVADNIIAEKFDAKPSSHTCRYCAFFNICPHSKADVLF